MRRILAIALSLALPSIALAAEWERLDIPNTTDEYFFDRSKLVINGNEVTYWKKVQFMPARPVKQAWASSTLMRERIDCREHTLRLLSFVYHDAQGAVIEYVADAEKDSAPIIPDTVGDRFEQVLCALVRESGSSFLPGVPKIGPNAL